MSTKKILNNVAVPDKTIYLSDIDSHLYKNRPFVVDFSFEGAFLSFEYGGFSNYLIDKKDFINRHRKIMTDINKLSDHNLEEIMNGKGYRHCHPLDSRDTEKAGSIIKQLFHILNKDDKTYEQLLGGEKIYQIGWESEVRLYGTIHGNIFRVYFIDYYHDFNYDQRRNNRNKKLCKFCPTKSEL